MSQIFAQIIRLFQRYSLGQRILFVLVFVGLISAIVVLLFWANRPEYQLLYTDLDPSNASKIVSELRDKSIKYRIENNGTTIKVPAEHVDELRLEFTEAGYVGEAIKGYQVFDDSKIGMTTFMQQLNMKRALEGELSKTINRFSEVKSSRVHLVLPKEKLFEEKPSGKASVVLYLQNGQYLNDSQIRGIAALVANSVDGIEASDVAVVDSDGNLLSSSKEESGVLSTAGNQWNLCNQVERKVESKVTRIVENLVGKENAVVKVSAELNFEKLEETTEEIDPENLAVISEEKQIESRYNLDSLNNTNEKHTRENVITNYETNKSVKHHVQNTGNIKRLSVAVLINGTYEEGTDNNGEKNQIYKPRSRQELAQITQLVKSAVGYNADRGDLVEVKNLRFNRTQIEEDRAYFEKVERRNLIQEMINKGLIVSGFLVAFFLIRRMMKGSAEVLKLSGGGKHRAALRTTEGSKYLAQGYQEEGEDEEEIPEDVFIKKLSPEARAKLKAKRKMINEVSKFIEQKPEDAAQLIQAWVTDKQGA